GLTLEPESAHLSRSGMIVTFSAPHFFNHFFGARDACPRLAGMHADSDRRLLHQVDAGFSRLRGHVDRVSRRANQNRCPAVDNCSYALRCRLASARDGQSTELPRPFPPCPKTDERNERKREVDTIARKDSGGLKDRLTYLRPILTSFLDLTPIHHDL